MRRHALGLAQRHSAVVDESDFLDGLGPGRGARGAFVEVEELAGQRQLDEVLGGQLNGVIDEDEDFGPINPADDYDDEA